MIFQEDITIQNLYVCSNRTSKQVKQKLIKEKINKPIPIMRYFACLSVKQKQTNKKNTKSVDLKNLISQINLIDLSSTQETFPGRGYKTNQSTLKY